MQDSTRNPRSARRPLATLSAIATALALCACASPYAPPTALTEPKGAAVLPPGLGYALALAEQQHASYRAKAIELGESERNFSNSVYGLGTVVLGLAAASAHSSALKAGALATGAVYGIGRLNTDRQRGPIYVQGMATLECAVAAVVPLSLSTDSDSNIRADRDRIKSGKEKLSKAIAAATATAALAQIYDPAMFATAIKAVDDAMVKANAAMDAATQADQLSRQRLEVPSTAAVGLRNTIKGIDREVLQQVDSTRPALQSIPEQLSQLKAGTWFTALAGLPADTAGAAPAATAKAGPHSDAFTIGGDAGKALAADRAFRLAQDLTSALGNLKGATAELKGTADSISSGVIATVSQTMDALKLCKVEGGPKPLTVAASTVRIAAGTVVIQQIFVEGGNGNLRAGFTQKPVPGLTVNIPPGTVGLVEVQGSDKSVAGTYPLLIEDTTMSSRITVSVIVEAASPTGAAPDVKIPADKGPGTAVAGAIADLKKRKEFKLADGSSVTVVDVVPRGTAGIEVHFSSSNAAITEPQVEQALKSDTQVSQFLGDKPDVKALRVNAPHAKTFDLPGAVRSLSSAQVRLLQARLCMPAPQRDGVWGPQTQRALEQDRGARDPRLSIPTGDLSDKERDQLLALTNEQAEGRCQQRGGK